MVFVAIEWVVFDLGEVVLARTERLNELADLLGVDADRLPDVYAARRGILDRDSDPALYWSAVAADLDLGPLSAELVNRLDDVDTSGWTVARPDTVELIEDLHAAGLGLAVCSNASSTMGRAAEVLPWAGRIRHFVFSGDLQVLKPEPAIYDAVLAATGASPESTVFFDDKQENVDGATRLGWHAFRFTNATAGRRDLAKLGVVLDGDRET
jgi:putative hydrolase of the HAD superfamily